MSWRTSGKILMTVGVVALSVALGGCGKRGGEQAGVTKQSAADDYVGSSSCRECHARFYELWSTSFHGLAMQPFTGELVRTKLTPQQQDVIAGQYRFRAEFTNDKGLVCEQGPKGEKQYPIVQVMGGKNVYYFLTPVERGRLQVLPVSYDVHRKEWFDTTASAMRHFAENPDQALHWTERPLTFNTSCHSCHVSQLAKNYDLATDTYHTTWSEPGINCETCHGPAGEHVRRFKAAPKDKPPKDIGLVVTSKFTHEQMNSACSPCHAKMHPLTAEYPPGAPYFDHFGLTALEDRDFYPDGRDLGENYTYTHWLLSPCAKSGQLDCMHCHTSSGRYRFRDADTNNACLPCHEAQVKDVAAHSHHKPGTEAAHCISCHMPMTEFARMRRSDHTMRPPMPAATIAFKSPNACNLCHTDKDAAWADKHVREWHQKDYQAPTLEWAALVAAARKQDWSKLPAMLEYLGRSDREEVVATGLIRLLRNCNNPQKIPALQRSLSDPSPLVRAAAVDALGDNLRPELVPSLLAATRDNFRLVRIQAATALARLQRETLKGDDLKSLEQATAEYKASLTARPDDPLSYYNLGNFYMDRHHTEQAVASYAIATRLQPELIQPWVNSALAYNLMGRNDKAEASLQQALKLDPTNAVASLNLGLLLGEQGRLKEAELALRIALKTDPRNAVAAYNLCVLTSKDNLDEAIAFCRKAAELQPHDAKYGYTLAFYLRQKGNTSEAVRMLEKLIDQQPATLDPYMLLAQIYEDQGKLNDAMAVYRQAMANEAIAADARGVIAAKVRSLPSQ